MAKNPNNKLPLKHAFYVATSFGGKTTAIKKLNLVTAKQVLFFDPYEDYKGIKFYRQQTKHFTNWMEFYTAAKNARRSSKPFKFGITVEPNPVNLERFAAIVWELGDGKKPLAAIFEELAVASNRVGKAEGRLGQCFTGGRRYAIECHSAFQRGQEVPKTIIGNSRYQWIGVQARLKDAKYLSEETGVPLAEIQKLQPGEYVLKELGRDIIIGRVYS
ncbi:hypothetical protein [Thaumasiovibrio subtropicus]|uniref:hypothetical protein n=1 Tax=Thaumasiovibrio subtropicus TaxID=1891207 RepID=UPI000B34AE44|nr:hypothetical protein [Thaumasiovibrio subtropicus]